MNKLLVALFSVAMMAGVVFAQVADIEPEGVLFGQKIDITTEGGRWLQSTFKPYQDKVIAGGSVIFKAELGSSQEEHLINIDRAMGEYYQSLQSMVPPAGLETYHSLMVALFRPEGPTSTAKKLGEAIKVDAELLRVFYQQGVQQNIIEGVIKRKNEDDRAYQDLLAR